MYGKSRLSMTQKKLERRSMDQMQDGFQHRRDSRRKLFKNGKKAQNTRKFPFFGLFGR